ncbi:MAG: hypothetical protein A3F91_03495 [Flavobacteria bacterium RIFCSPLOWO2_12_FULL_35_11]|nr:MAG: hypothetical protein A3F91_03495 [Flavobacteria bacterium RIFCSPLOWO2_12_FULL_35_11]
MKKMMNIIMLSCKKATELIEKRWVTKLSPVEKIQLKMHTAVCGQCATYEKQSEIIEKSLEKINKQENVPMKLSSEKKEQILEALKKTK